MRVLVKEKLSPHRYKTPEGYLICTDAILARTGLQEYTKNEVFNDGSSEIINIDRPEKEVFDEKTLASFENKPITIEHPEEDVNVDNYKDYAVGFIRDIHKGDYEGSPVILGNLVITDKDAINLIESGEMTDLSCGYDCDVVDDNGGFSQTHIRGNHLALCKEGRAGVARIIDSKIKDWAPNEVRQFKVEKRRRGYGVYYKGQLVSKYDDYDREEAEEELHRLRKYYYVDSKVEDSDEWTIKNTGLAYEVLNGGKLIKKFTTKRQAIEWIQSRFPEDEIVEDSKMKDSYIEINTNEIDDEQELRVDCANLGLVYINNGKYYGIRGAKKDIWKLLAMYNMNEKKKYIEDDKAGGFDYPDNKSDADITWNNGLYIGKKAGYNRYAVSKKLGSKYVVWGVYTQKELRKLNLVEDSINDSPMYQKIETENRKINIYGQVHNSVLYKFQSYISQYLKEKDENKKDKLEQQILNEYRQLVEDYKVDSDDAKKGNIKATIQEVKAHYNKEVNNWIKKVPNTKMKMLDSKQSTLDDALKIMSIIKKIKK